MEPDDAVLDEAVHRGESMNTRDLFDLVERSREGTGVERQALTAYARALESRRDYAFDADGFLAEIDDRTTATDRWDGAGRYYEVGDERLSQYPARWHDRLAGERDPTTYLEFLADEARDFEADLDEGAAGDGVPETRLVHVMEVVGRLDRETAKGAIEEARDDGEISEDADQHPETNVILGDEER